MTFSVFMYVMMLAASVALAGVLVVDAARALARRSAQRGARSVAPAQRRAAPTTSGARNARVPAPTR